MLNLNAIDGLGTLLFGVRSVDYKRLKAATTPQTLRIPLRNTVLHCVGETKSQFYSVLDFSQEFHQIPLHPNSMDKKGFITPSGKCRYKTTPQATRNMPMIFQTSEKPPIQTVMGDIDGICVFSPTLKNTGNAYLNPPPPRQNWGCSKLSHPIKVKKVCVCRSQWFVQTLH